MVAAWKGEPGSLLLYGASHEFNRRSFLTRFGARTRAVKRRMVGISGTALHTAGWMDWAIFIHNAQDHRSLDQTAIALLVAADGQHKH